MNVEVNQGESEYHDKLYHLDLTIFIEDEHNFVYQIWPVRYIAPTFSERGKRGKQYYYRLETFLYEGSQDNDLVGYTKEQVINDILDKCSKSIEISFKLNNIAMECYVTDISIVRNDVLGNNGLLTPIKKDGEHNSIGQIDNYQFSFSIFGDDIDKLSVVGNFEYIYKLLSSIVIKISYAIIIINHI